MRFSGYNPATMCGRAAVLALMLVLSLNAVAQRGSIHREGVQWTEETYGTVPATAEVVLSLPEGSMIVNGGNQQSISWQLRKRITAGNEAAARQQFASAHLGFRRQHDKSWIEGSYASGAPRTYMELTITVPRSTHLVKLYAKNGSMHVAGLDGGTALKLGAGNLRVDRISGPVWATVGMGAVDIGKVGGDLTVHTTGARVRIGAVQGKVVAESGGGNISIEYARLGINAQTSSGDIKVGGCSGDVMLNTGGGSVELGAVTGKATLQTTMGNVHLGHADGPVTASTGGGKINLWGLTKGANARVTGGGTITAEFLSGAFNDSSLQTPAGDIVVYVNPSIRATVQATIEMGNYHRLVSSVSEVRVTSEGSQYGPLKVLYAEGKLNGGGPPMRLRTTNGNITFRHSNR